MQDHIIDDIAWPPARREIEDPAAAERFGGRRSERGSPPAGRDAVITSGDSMANELDPEDLIALIPQTRAFARLLCHGQPDAEDLSQEALALAWRYRRHFTPGTNLRAWVFRILRNHFYTAQRRARWSTSLDPALGEALLAVAPNPTVALELEDVRRAMMKLPSEQREALVLIAVSGMRYHEAALVCHCAAGTIKSRVSRARHNLQVLLEEDRCATPRSAYREAFA
jgi:RNA polymerase sigma-70 factor (ECF subfamily)